MDFADLLSRIPGWAWLILALGLAGPLLSVATALAMFVLKRIVIFRERGKAPYADTGDYRLAQGREIRPERDPGPQRE